MATDGAATASLKVAEEAIVGAAEPWPTADVTQAAEQRAAEERFTAAEEHGPTLPALQRLAHQLRMPAHRMQPQRIAAANMPAVVAVGMRAAGTGNL